MICQECAFFHEDYGHGHQCRRYPKWELHTPEDWCGEFVAVKAIEDYLPSPALPVVVQESEIKSTEKPWDSVEKASEVARKEWKKKKRY